MGGTNIPLQSRLITMSGYVIGEEDAFYILKDDYGTISKIEKNKCAQITDIRDSHRNHIVMAYTVIR